MTRRRYTGSHNLTMALKRRGYPQPGKLANTLLKLWDGRVLGEKVQLNSDQFHWYPNHVAFFQDLMYRLVKDGYLHQLTEIKRGYERAQFMAGYQLDRHRFKGPKVIDIWDPNSHTV